MRARTYHDVGAPLPLSCQHIPTPDYYAPGTMATVAGVGRVDVGGQMFTPGYAITPDGRTICYGCADADQRARMAAGETIGAYLSSDGAHVTTWTGGKLARVTAHGVSRYGAWGRSPLHYVTAVTPDGAVWRGRNSGEGMAITMRPARARA